MILSVCIFLVLRSTTEVIDQILTLLELSCLQSTVERGHIHFKWFKVCGRPNQERFQLLDEPALLLILIIGTGEVL